jgi:hypothetical protein
MIWKFLTVNDAKELTAWTNDQLDQQHAKEQMIGNLYIQFGQEHSDPDDPATFKRYFEAASAGDTTLFEIDYPELAKRFFPAAAKRGRTRDDKVWAAARDVRLIRLFWKQHKKFLDGKFKPTQRRTGTSTVEAEQIAADRWGVDVEAVRHRLHKKPKSVSGGLVQWKP